MIDKCPLCNRPRADHSHCLDHDFAPCDCIGVEELGRLYGITLAPVAPDGPGLGDLGENLGDSDRSTPQDPAPNDTF